MQVDSSSTPARYTPAQMRHIIELEWQRALGVWPTDTDNFFDLGGNSLTAVTVTGRLRPALGAQLKLSALLIHPVLNDYVTYVHQIWADLPANNAPVRISRDGELPLPYVLEQLVQNELKAVREATPSTALPLTHVALSIQSHLSNEAIAAALKQVIARHEILRTKVDVDANTNHAGVSLDTEMDWQLSIRECGDLSEAERTDCLVREKAAMLEKPIDLEHAPLLHAGLYDFTRGYRVLMLAIDHMIVDGRSVGVITGDLSAALNGALEPAAEDRLDFFDWAAWQRAQLTGPGREELIKFWRTELEGIGPHPDLAVPRPTRETAAVWYAAQFKVVSDDAAALISNRESGTAVLETLLAAIALTWRRLQGQYEAVIYVPTGDRVDSAFEGLVGSFAHALPVRIQVPDDDLPTALQTASQALLRTLTHQELPTPELLGALSPESRLGRRPGRLFLGLGLTELQEFDVPGGTMERLNLPSPVNSPAQPGISFYANREDGGLALMVAADPREVDADFIDVLSEQLAKVLTELCSLVRQRSRPSPG